MNALRIISPGVLSLLQDAGRFGQGKLGLTQGGPLDGHSFRWANALVGNPTNSTLIEHSVGGLILQAACRCTLAVTGAVMPLSLNGQAVACWQPLHLNAGDELALGQFSLGLRAYIAVAGGIQVAPHFGSSATVMREGIGGLIACAATQLNTNNNNPHGTHDQTAGQKLHAAALLPLATPSPLMPRLADPAHTQPTAVNTQSLPTALTLRSLPTPAGITLRVIEGYQAHLFNACQRARFYLNPFTVSGQIDRMGYKLNGSTISCDTRQLLSEGISYGAIQIPPDGQPIVLLNDRQTLGGYPKMGNVLSLDCWQLAQASPGTQVNFSPISAEAAHNILQLDAARFMRERQQFCANNSANTECER